MIYHHIINKTINLRIFQQKTVQCRRITCCRVEWSPRKENIEQKSLDFQALIDRQKGADEEHRIKGRNGGGIRVIQNFKTR